MTELNLIEPMKQQASERAMTFIKKAFQFVTLHGLDIGWSIGINRTDVTLAECKAFVNSFNVGKKRFVVIEWENVYEVARVCDDIDVEIFYKKPKPEKVDNVYSNEHYIDLVRKCIADYMALDGDKLQAYVKDVSLRDKGVIPYAYLQRKMYYYRTITNAVDRKIVVQRAIDLSCECMSPPLGTIDKTDALLHYGTHAKMYRFNAKNVLV